MVASSGLLFCSRKHSISSDLGSGSRIIDNEKRKYWGARFYAPFCSMCIRWCQMLNSTTTFHLSRKCLDCSLPSLPVWSFPFRSSFTIPYALRIKWGTGTLNPHPTIPNSPGKLQRKSYTFGRTHAGGIHRHWEGKKGEDLPLGYGCHWTEYGIIKIVYKAPYRDRLLPCAGRTVTTFRWCCLIAQGLG